MLVVRQFVIPAKTGIQSGGSDEKTCHPARRRR